MSLQAISEDEYSLPAIYSPGTHTLTSALWTLVTARNSGAEAVCAMSAYLPLATRTLFVDSFHPSQVRKWPLILSLFKYLHLLSTMRGTELKNLAAGSLGLPTPARCGK